MPNICFPPKLMREPIHGTLIAFLIFAVFALTACGGGAGGVGSANEDLYMEETYGNWTYQDFVDIQTMAGIGSNEDRDNKLTILCRESKGILMVTINYSSDVIGSHTVVENWQKHPVLYRFDKEPAVQDYWELGYDSGENMFLMIPTNKNQERVAFVLGLMTYDELLVSTGNVYKPNSFHIDRTFSIHGGGKALVGVMESCGFGK